MPSSKREKKKKKAALEEQKRCLEEKHEKNADKKGMSSVLAKAAHSAETAKLKTTGPKMEIVIKPKKWQVATLERFDRGAPFSALVNLDIASYGYKYAVHTTDGKTKWFYEASVPIPEGQNDDGKFSVFTIGARTPFGLGFRNL